MSGFGRTGTVSLTNKVPRVIGEQPDGTTEGIQPHEFLWGQR